MTEGQTPAGWYDDGQGQQRWFDGTAWTDHVLPAAEPPVAAAPEPVLEPAVADPAAGYPPAGYAAPPAAEAPAEAVGRRSGTSTADGPPPFYKRPWVVAAAVILLLVVVVAAVASASSDSGDTPTASGTPTTPTALTTTAAPTTGAASPTVAPTTSAATTTAASPSSTALSDGDWTVASYQLKQDAIGSFGGTARITYTGTDTTGGAASFTFTVLKDGKQVATLIGSVLDAQPGQTKTTDLISTDSYVKGPYSSVEFQKDF